MPTETYSTLPDTVLAWKKANHLGRFDPNSPAIVESKTAALWASLKERNISVGQRCQIGEETARRGEVMFVGEVDEIPGLKGPWIGVKLDEPAGRNDGSVSGKRYFEAGEKRGVFVRPERVSVGEYPVVEEEWDEDMEEI